jgi:outer membrane protein assembly factor BamB
MISDCTICLRCGTRSRLVFTSILFFAGLCVGQPSVSLSPKSGPPTSNIQVSGKGFKPYDAIDIYFDAWDAGLAVADGSGTFSEVSIQATVSANPGRHWVSAVQRSGHAGDQVPFMVNTNWNQFQFSPSHSGFNPYENVLSPSTVGGIGLRWSFPTVGQVESSPVETNGVVFVGAGFTVYALTASAGALLWQYSTGSFVGGAAVSGGAVYVSSADHNVYALSASTGALLWTYQTVEGIVPTTPTVANGMVYVGSWDKNVYALNANTGAVIWQYAAGSSVVSTPAVANGTVYFGSDDSNIYALNARTGSLLWRYTTGSFVDSAPTVVNGVLYAGSWDKNIYALNAYNGALLWQYETDSSVRTSPAVVDGTAYVASDGGLVYALNAYTGSLLWDYDSGSGDDGFSPSSVSVADGVVYAGFQNGNICALHAGHGGLLWQYTTGNAVSSTPAIVNGTVYVGSWDNNAYAFGLFGRHGTRRPELGALQANLKAAPSKSAANLNVRDCLVNSGECQ